MARLPPLLDEHFKRPRRALPPSEESLSGEAENAACGDWVELWLAAEAEGRWRSGFRARGCSATLACASLIASRADQGTWNELLALDVAAEIEKAGGLPVTSRHALEVVARALERALARAAPGCHS